jgi:acylaminoacyl-peptidase
MPRWSPDGERIAYLSDRAGWVQIRVGRLESGEDTAMSAVTQVPLSLAWSPDGARLAFTARVAGAPPAWAPPAILPMLRVGGAARVQVFVVASNGGAARQVTDGDLDFSGAPAWMPEGQTIVVAAGGAIYAIHVTDGTARALTANGLCNESPVPSPDGARIAFLATESKPQSYAIRKLCVMNADGSRVKVLSGLLDRDASLPQWSSDSRTVYFIADDRGSTNVYAARRDGTLRQATRAGQTLRGFSVADNGRAVSVRSSRTEAGSVVSFAVDTPSEPLVLAAPNEHLLAERDMGRVEEIHYESDGKSIQGWVVKPPVFDASKKYPLLLDIQDTPRRMYGEEFPFRAQVYAAQGYVVLCANPRGTPGFGEEFGYLLRTRFPGDDYEDLMRGVDFVAARGYVDPKRLFVTGGLVAAWAIGHTDRFRAAVAVRPIADWVTDVATAPNGPQRARDWMGAMPWDDPEQYVKHSPIFFAQNFKTPTLVIGGVYDAGADELYFALQARNVDSALVKLRDESKPGARVLELETVLRWFGRF